MSLLAFCIVALHQPGMVTFYEPAGAAPKVLADLGKMMGVKLVTSPQTEGSTLLISVKDVDQDGLLKRIALATAGEWHEIPGGFRLVPSAALRSVRAQEEHRNNVAKFSRSIQLKPAAANAKTAPPRTESDDVAYGLLRGLNAGQLAELESGDRIVFSNRPTAMQLPLGAGSEALINQWVSSHNQSASKAKSNDAQLEQAFGGNVPEFIKDQMMQASRVVNEPVEKVNLVVQKVPFVGLIQAQIRAYDSKGSVLLSGTSNLAGDDLQKIIDLVSKKPVNAVKGAAIEYSEDSQKFRALLQSSGLSAQMGMTMKLVPAFRKKLFHPEQYDPLSFSVTDELVAVAKTQGRPLVAALPDALFQSLLFGSQKAATVEEVEANLTAGKEAKVLEDPQYLVLTPAEPEKERRHHLNRMALGQLLQSSEQHEVPSLDDIAAYALKNESPMDSPIATTYVGLFASPALQQGISGFLSWDLVRFYGTLGAPQRQALISGSSISLSSLDTEQLRDLHRAVYGPLYLIDVDRTEEAKPDMFTKMMRAFTGGGKDFRDEPTEVLANGIPPQGTFSMTATTESFVRPIAEEGSTSFAILGADEIGIYRLVKESPMFAQMGGKVEFPAQGKLGERTVYNLHFQLVPGVAVNQTLQDNRLTANAPIVSLSQLPDSFQKQVDDHYREFKKSPLAAMLALGGGRAINPP